MHTDNGEVCDTIYYQGMSASQTQALKYTGNQKIRATTGELMWCTGKNNLPPINIIHKLYIGREIADVNLQPFSTYRSMLNPVNWLGSFFSWSSNYANGFHFSPAVNPSPESVVFHAPVLSNISIGQETDIESHRRKYQSWLKKDDRTKGLILFGVSRGTATTFCAFAKEKYPEVRLVILEGAVDSISNVLPQRYTDKFNSEYIANKVVSTLNFCFTFFTAYKPTGISPLACVADYPVNVPTVFITSEIDESVPCKNTERIAKALANRGKNDVYLLRLKNSTHPNYMFDNQEDRDNYETFIHAIYQKYNLEHDVVLANKGEHLLKACTLFELASRHQYANN